MTFISRKYGPMKFLVGCLATLLVATIAIPAAAASTTSELPPEISAIERTMTSVVRILKPDGVTAGSGFAYDDTGHIITNAHVVVGQEKVRIVLNSGRLVDADVGGIDPRLDLAILKLPPMMGQSPLPLTFHAPKPGQRVFALGSPLGFPFSVTGGIVSGTRRAYDSAMPIDFLQHDAAINPGSSGGPLIDEDGKVLGMNTTAPPEAVFDVGVGLAIPSNVLATTADRLIRDGKIERGALGLMVSIANEGVAEALSSPGKRGLLVDHVLVGQASSRAGIQAGDIILTIDSVALREPRDLSIWLLNSWPGQEVQLGLVRKGKHVDVSIVLQEDDAALFFYRAPSRPSLRPYTQNFGISFDQRDTSQAMIAKISGASAAELAGLQPGDIVMSVNGNSAPDAVAATQLLVGSVSDVTVLRVLRRGVGIRHVTLPRNENAARFYPPGNGRDRSVGPI